LRERKREMLTWGFNGMMDRENIWWEKKDEKSEKIHCCSCFQLLLLAPSFPFLFQGKEKKKKKKLKLFFSWRVCVCIMRTYIGLCNEKWRVVLLLFCCIGIIRFVYQQIKLSLRFSVP
jgi:hypothetical protein